MAVKKIFKWISLKLSMCLFLMLNAGEIYSIICGGVILPLGVKVVVVFIPRCNGTFLFLSQELRYFKYVEDFI